MSDAIADPRAQVRDKALGLLVRREPGVAHLSGHASFTTVRGA